MGFPGEVMGFAALYPSYELPPGCRARCRMGRALRNPSHQATPQFPVDAKCCGRRCVHGLLCLPPQVQFPVLADHRRPEIAVRRACQQAEAGLLINRPRRHQDLVGP